MKSDPRWSETAHQVFKTGRAGQPPAWMVRFHRRSVDENRCKWRSYFAGGLLLGARLGVGPRCSSDPRETPRGMALTPVSLANSLGGAARGSAIGRCVFGGPSDDGV